MPLVFAEPLPMTDAQRAQLEKMARSPSLPHRTVVQAEALLLAADGVGTNEVARRCNTTDDSVIPTSDTRSGASTQDPGPSSAHRNHISE